MQMITIPLLTHQLLRRIRIELRRKINPINKQVFQLELFHVALESELHKLSIN
mgnify:CR=1 FL=1